MSLPDFLSSSYKQYKEDTNCFTTWLHQTAKACGYNSHAIQISGTASKQSEPVNPSKRLKGKDRKAAKVASHDTPKSSVDAIKAVYPKPVRYRSMTHEILQQAKLISESKKQSVGLPGGIQFVVRRAIAARQRFASHFAAVKGVDGASNAAHVHFNETLQGALDLLTYKSSSESTATNDQEAEARSLSNKFEALEVEDTYDEYPLTPVEVSLATSKTKKTDAAPDVYELQDEDSEMEDPFNLYCFFEDLHNIQEHIKKAWTRFASGETSLNVVTILTQAGMDMVKRLEKETYSRLKHVEPGKGDMYTNMTLPILCVDALRNAQDPMDIVTSLRSMGSWAFRRASTHNMGRVILCVDALRNAQDPMDIVTSLRSLEHLPIHDLVYLPRARTLKKFARYATPQRMETWPPLIPSMRSEYMGRPDLLELPEYQQRCKEDEKLTQLLLDLFLLDDTKFWVHDLGGDEIDSDMFLKDEFARAVGALWDLRGLGKDGVMKGFTATPGGVTVHAVFASQVIMDILEICAGHRRPPYHMRLLETAKLADERIGFAKDSKGKGYTREIEWLRTKQNTTRLDKMWHLIFTHSTGQGLASWKRNQLRKDAEEDTVNAVNKQELFWELLTESQQKIGVAVDEDRLSGQALEALGKAITPAALSDFLATHDGLHCGTLSMKLALALEDLGLELANHHLSIFVMSHLYNALHKMQLIDIRWPEMDQLIDMHCGTLFAGVIPETSEEIFRRYEYRSGIGYAGERARDKKVWHLKAGAASASLNNLVESKDTVENVILQLEEQIESHTTPINFKRPKPNKTIANRRRQLQPIQVLTRLEEYLPVVLRDVDFDYITLTKTCKSLLEELTIKLRDDSFMAKAGHQSKHLELVNGILKDNIRAELLHQKRKDKSTFEGGDQIKEAADIFKAFFSSLRAKPVSKKQNAELVLRRRQIEETRYTTHNHAASGEPECELCVIHAEVRAEQQQRLREDMAELLSCEASSQ